jgi:hypothetical protein
MLFKHDKHKKYIQIYSLAIFLIEQSWNCEICIVTCPLRETILDLKMWYGKQKTEINGRADSLR